MRLPEKRMPFHCQFIFVSLQERGLWVAAPSARRLPAYACRNGIWLIAGAGPLRHLCRTGQPDKA